MKSPYVTLLLYVLLVSLRLRFLHATFLQRETQKTILARANISRQWIVPVPAAKISHKSNLSTEQLYSHWKSHQPKLLFPHSASKTVMKGFFGLGGLEIVVICVGVGVLLGPQKIGSMIRATGETASEFKVELSKVPDEFQKGYEEGQIEARSRKAKPIVPDDKMQ
jgi:Sec-independent protein translocase protein TatA